MNSEDSDQWPKKKKRQERKESVIKKKKLVGEEHINYVGKTVPAKCVGDDCRCNRLRCFQTTTAEKRQQIFSDFYRLESKNAQDSYLAGLITVDNVKQRRPRKVVHEEVASDSEGTGSQSSASFAHNISFYYKVRVTADTITTEVPVCREAFMAFHAISRGRLRTVQQHISANNSCSPMDMRGKHNNRPRAVPRPLRDLIEHHISLFKPRVSHYSLRKNLTRRYLPETLTVKKMHEVFLDEYQINVPYKLYWEVFNTFNISFGYPRSDTCSICDALEKQIPAASNSDKSGLIVEKELHLRKAEAFYERKRHYKQKARQGLVTVVTFDYMQNLPVPQLTTNAIFYARQLWYYVFGVHDLATDEAVMFTYHEGVAKRGQSEVTSLLFHYLKNRQHLARDLVLISDGCAGQNKNFVMMYFLYMLVHSLKMFNRITYLFPMRGHSFLPNDQDLSLISCKKKNQVIEVPDDWDAVITSSRKHPTPFHICRVEQSMIFNMKEAVEHYFKPSTKKIVKLKGLRMYKIEAPTNYIFVRDSYTGPWRTVALRNNVKIPRELTFSKMYNDAIKIKKSKVEDLKGLFPFLTSESQNFFKKLFACGEEEDGPNVDVIESDDSSGEDQ